MRRAKHAAAPAILAQPRGRGEGPHCKRAHATNLGSVGAETTPGPIRKAHEPLESILVRPSGMGPSAAPTT